MVEFGQSVLEPAPMTASMVQYDFEDYALTKGIPDTLDPLPYRKSGSVFATGDDAVPTMTSAKYDPRLRTVVCRHWLRDLCMKGAACEFLHQYDLSKMPLCRHGERCKVRDCPFRHINEADRLECVFYSQGFCIHGPFCRYRHVQRDRADLPLVADFTLGLSQMQAGKDGGMTMRRPAAKPNEFYKVSLCKHFQNGECPFGEGCHFAHGEAELRRYPKPGLQSGTDGEELGENMDCAVSTVRGEWYVQERHAEMINKAIKQGMQVMTFFTVGDSLHIQGAALVTSKAEMAGGATKRKRQPKSDAVSADKDGPFCYRFKCVWYRTCELPVSTALDAAPDLLLPTPATRYCQDMTSKSGEAVMKAVWNSPLCTLYESFSDEGDESRKPPAPENILKDFRCPLPGEVPWPTMPSPGFIFGCNSQTMDECLGRGLFGLPAHMKGAAAGIRPGSSIFLYNVSEKLFFGIFESLTSARMNIEPQRDDLAVPRPDTGEDKPRVPADTRRRSCPERHPEGARWRQDRPDDVRPDGGPREPNRGPVRRAVVHGGVQEGGRERGDERLGAADRAPAKEDRIVALKIRMQTFQPPFDLPNVLEPLAIRASIDVSITEFLCLLPESYRSCGTPYCRKYLR
ncbi:hypothetical protein THAOC_31122 [Thalassiosira oceanica]|uniref:RING-type E3 ubiquitin transferase n=2 Tax=Thalassiosira oceanica TaxID=159749 RepID=K0RCC8_THAOC|nr:hypothetical protein THAOC_31122 [Thalassiosira oceanica]|eukprot:EJK49944.1 hypothetical protein THAOC_31122 [Thalassiosira oceanica]